MEALPPSAEERRSGCGGDLRSCDAAFDAICRRALAGEPGDVDASQDAGDVGLATHTAAQRAARPFNRGRRYRGAGTQARPELAGLVEACDETIPFEVCEVLAPLVVQLRNLDDAITQLEHTIARLAQRDETARRLMSIPGFGPIIASAMAATVQDVSSFAGPREFAAFLGLTPKQNSSGGKPKLGRISKMGNRNLRKLLVVGAHSVLFHRKLHIDPLRMWAKKLIEKKPFKLVAVALANNLARIAFTIMRNKATYREMPA